MPSPYFPEDQYSLTRGLAEYAVNSQFSALPADVRVHATRALINWLGCAFGGCQEMLVDIAVSALSEAGSKPEATVIGYGLRSTVTNAAFLNSMSAGALGYDDAHLATVAHPSSPAAAAVFAFSQAHVVSGEDFLNALALGIELQCRVAEMLVLPPSKFNQGLYVNGFSGPIGVAASTGRLLELDVDSMTSALGIAAIQSAGFRGTHGSMTAPFLQGHATRAGTEAALLAAKGFRSTSTALEAPFGFLDVYAGEADPNRALDGLGDNYEMLANMYKPYPCGIVIHPTIDACLQLAPLIHDNRSIARVQLQLHPLALSLTGCRHPKDSLEAQVSVFHWAAAVLVHRETGVANLADDRVNSPDLALLRELVEAEPDPRLDKGQAIAEVTLTTGDHFEAKIDHPRGSLARPMSDGELDDKFMEQASLLLPLQKCEELRDSCRNVANLPDVGTAIGNLLD